MEISIFHLVSYFPHRTILNFANYVRKIAPHTSKWAECLSHMSRLFWNGHLRSSRSCVRNNILFYFLDFQHKTIINQNTMWHFNIFSLYCPFCTFTWNGSEYLHLHRKLELKRFFVFVNALHTISCSFSIYGKFR